MSKPTKRQIAAAKKYIREHEFEIRVHAILQVLGYTRKVRELERGTPEGKKPL